MDIAGTNDVQVGLVEQHQAVIAVEQRDRGGEVLDGLKQQILRLEGHAACAVLLRQVAPGAAVAEELAAAGKQRHAADRPVLPLARVVHVDVAEVTEGPVRREVVQVRLPLFRIGVAGAEILARLAEGEAGVDSGDLAQALRHEAEAQLGIHLPEPVGGGRGEVLQAGFALAQGGVRPGALLLQPFDFLDTPPEPLQLLGHFRFGRQGPKIPKSIQ